MTNPSTISNLPPAGALTGAEYVPIVQNGVTVRTTTAAVTVPSQVNVVAGGNGISVVQAAGTATVSLSTPVSIANGGTGATSLANLITNADLVAMGANTVKVNATAGSANPTDLALSLNTVLGRGPSGNAAAIALPVSGIIASSRNMIIVQASTTTITITYDEVIAKVAAGGQAYLGTSGSFTLNFGTNGVNGLDTGSIVAGTQYGVFSIFNPTTVTWATLASNSLTSPSLPSGYTAFALIGIVRTDTGGATLPVTTQYDREVFFQTPQTIFTNQTGVASLTSQSVSGPVPTIAKTCSGIFTENNTANAVNLQVAGDATGYGLQQGPVVTVGSISNSTSFTLSFRQLVIITSRTIFINMGNTASVTNSLKITSFTF